FMALYYSSSAFADTLTQPFSCPQVRLTWSFAEQEIFRSLCDTTYALPVQRRSISPQFLQDLLFDPIYHRNLSKRGLNLSNIAIKEPIVLRGHQIEGSLSITDSEFYSIVDLTGTDLLGDLNLLHSNLIGGLQLDRAHISGSLIIGEATESDPDPKKQRGGFI